MPAKNKKYLITGCSGFVGAHLIESILKQGDRVMGVDLNRPRDSSYDKIDFAQISLMEYGALESVLKRFQPDYIIHLASASSVGMSWKEPMNCFTNNTNIFLNLLEAVRKIELNCRILSVGSSEEYGSVNINDVPLKEEHPLNPLNPYAVARVAQEQLSHVYSKGYGIDIICTRSFNHIGPGQMDRFVISSFVRQAVEVFKGQKKEIICGDLNVTRDFTDVRDVVTAYLYLLKVGQKNDIYNICSGQGRSLKNVIDYLCTQLKISPTITTSSSLVRPIESPIVVGDNSKISKLGFKFVYKFEQSLSDMIDWWGEELKKLS